MTLNELRGEFSRRQKKGIHFIATSVIIWALIFIVQLTEMKVLNKNLWTFICTTPLMPVAALFAKALNIPFTEKGNPLNDLGGLFSMNQMLYLLIAMWVFPTVPDKMVMVFAMIFGAHLLPYSWLYQSKAYAVFAVAIPFIALVAGLMLNAAWVAGIMVFVEISFTALLALECRREQAK